MGEYITTSQPGIKLEAIGDPNERRYRTESDQAVMFVSPYVREPDTTFYLYSLVAKNEDAPEEALVDILTTFKLDMTTREPAMRELYMVDPTDEVVSALYTAYGSENTRLIDNGRGLIGIRATIGADPNTLV